MKLLIIILSLTVVSIFTLITFYTSVNSGAEKVEQWFTKLTGKKK
jgi:hypothetical protein